MNDAKKHGKFKLYDASGCIGYTTENIQETQYISIIKDGSGVGRVRILPKDSSFLATMGAIKVKDRNADLNFIYYQLQCVDFSKHILGANIPHVYFSSYGSDYYFLPCIDEQNLLGQFFQNLDQSIALHEQKLTQTQNLKQAMLEKMFPKAGSKQPEIRLKGFSGDWEIKTIGSILKIKSGMSQKNIEKKNGKYPILATGGEIGRTDTPIYSKETVLIGRKGTIDKPYYMNSPFWTVDTLFYSEINEGNFAYFVFVLFQKIKWRHFNTSTGVPSLTSSTIHSIEIQVPKFEEQLKIAKSFQQIDKTLALYQQQLQTLKNLKQAFLTKMFV